MIALDTNILVRLVLQDDAAQARIVERLLVQARREGTNLYIADVVLCELAWVLTRRAKIARAAIADTIGRLLRTELVVVTDARSIEGALDAFKTGRGDFADYLIRAQSQKAGATDVVTFDRALKGDAGFRILG